MIFIYGIIAQSIVKEVNCEMKIEIIFQFKNISELGIKQGFHTTSSQPPKLDDLSKHTKTMVAYKTLNATSKNGDLTDHLLCNKLKQLAGMFITYDFQGPAFTPGKRFLAQLKLEYDHNDHVWKTLKIVKKLSKEIPTSQPSSKKVAN